MEKRAEKRSTANIVGTLVIFLTVLLAECGWGFYSAYANDYLSGDSLSRVANAFYVLYSRDPHLGAIGFVWNPLPSLLEMIPLLAWPVFPAVASAGLASVLVTAVCAAAAAAMLFGAARRNGLPIVVSLAFVALYAANPFIFIYGANGMSESIFGLFIVGAVIAFTDWLRTTDVSRLVMMGLYLALGFWTRYEAIALGVGVAACVAVKLWADTRRRDKRAAEAGQTPTVSSGGLRGLWWRTESTMFVLLTPAVASGLAWMFFNYAIMGDPLYFLRSGYSNLAFAQDLASNTDFMRAISDPLRIVQFVLRKSVYFGLPLVAIILVRLLTNRLWRKETLMLLLLAASIPAMQYAMLFKNSSYGWLRFFVYSLLVAAAWLPYEIGQLRGRKLRWRAPLIGLLLVSVAASAFVYRDMNNPVFASEEYGSFHMKSSQSSRDERTYQSIAAYVDRLQEADPSTIVLTDSFSAFPILVASRHPKQWAITNDRDFRALLGAPQQAGIAYILVSKPKGSVYQVIHDVYPELYDGGISWTRLEHEFDDGAWRLYRIVPESATESAESAGE